MVNSYFLIFSNRAANPISTDPYWFSLLRNIFNLPIKEVAFSVASFIKLSLMEGDFI